MEDIICYTSQLSEGAWRNITFMELLLNENWADGKIECPESYFAEVGDFNHKLAAKQNYEFLLRAIQKYPLKVIGVSDASDRNEEPKSDWESYRTDCYIAAKYQQQLSEAGFLDIVMKELTSEALKFPQPEMAVRW